MRNSCAHLSQEVQEYAAQLNTPSLAPQSASFPGHAHGASPTISAGGGGGGGGRIGGSSGSSLMDGARARGRVIPVGTTLLDDTGTKHGRLPSETAKRRAANEVGPRARALSLACSLARSIFACRCVSLSLRVFYLTLLAQARRYIVQSASELQPSILQDTGPLVAQVCLPLAVTHFRV